MRVSQEEVQSAFERFQLLDSRVHFHKVRPSLPSMQMPTLQLFCACPAAVRLTPHRPLARHAACFFSPPQSLVHCAAWRCPFLTPQGFFRYALPAWRAQDKSPIALLRMDGGAERVVVASVGVHAGQQL